ncbi:MAG: cysteine hydrolase family protein [Candidatus Woesearchaeota archaeon]
MKTIFWNVDTQYDFMRDDESFKGALPIPGAREIESNLERLTMYANETRIQVVNTADYHTPASEELSDTPDFKSTFPPHCLKGTRGADFISATEPVDGWPVRIYWDDADFDEEALQGHCRNIVIYKDRFDVFTGNPHTEKVLEAIRPDRAVVYGVATNVCVDYAVRGLLKRGVEVYVPTDAIKELSGLPLEETIRAWQDNGAKLVTVDDIVKYNIMD